MDTNQDMTVRIGNGNIKIGHLTQMGKLNDIFNIGNEYRLRDHKKKKTIEQFLSLPDTWEFILEVEQQQNPNRRYDDLEIPTKDKGTKIKYGEAIKLFSVVKSQKGGKPENRGVWANLHILLKGAMYLSPKLEYEVIDVFLNSKILFFRDLGGDNFKKFNKIIDSLPDRNDKNNNGVYIQVAILVRQKLEIIDTKGYNEEEHNAFIQEKRSEYLSNLTSMIKVGLVTSYPQLKEVIKKL
ncbi:MAG: DNA-binding protein [Endozoicomonadaceae bacterium]|nr:DNA-binding protein [Endozoicomonadaceae bacterium]